jgi:dTDP-4-dehydrorhamnose 3,5-epimerase
MRFLETEIAGAVVVHPEPHSDDRGSFARVFCVEEFRRVGLEPHIEQVNLAVTTQPGTVRGLHYQLPPVAEAKLVRCVRGAVFDVVADLRPQSRSFGRHVGVELTATEATALYVPPGCAHGYQSLTPDAALLYQVSAPYSPTHERGVAHADPDLAIRWPLLPCNLSQRDRGLPRLADAELPKVRG